LRHNDRFGYFCNVISDKEFKVVINRCDICDDRLECQDDMERQIDRLDEIDNSYESEADRTTYYDGPKLLLCDYCSKEYMIPGYPI
jgi:hypothetical protein